MSANGYQYVIELFREDDSPLGQASVKVDWGPAEEWARFQAWRRSHLESSQRGRVSSIEPLWRREVGEPYLEGFRVNVAAGETNVATDFTTNYFKTLAAQAANHFIENGQLESGHRFRFLAAAFRQQPQQTNGSRFQFTTEEVVRPIAIRQTSLAESLKQSAPHGTNFESDAAVLVPQRVLDEATNLSREAGEKETGGILIGHLHRDHTIPDIFVEVTAQIHARHTEADLTKLTFTAETWTEVQAAIDLRRKDEIMVGWWHSHPVREWCKNCSPESQRVCRMSSDFFSSHDQALHRTVFPSAYNVALVANDLPSGDVTFSAFGWRDALIESRGFHVIADALPAARANEAISSQSSS